MFAGKSNKMGLLAKKGGAADVTPDYPYGGTDAFNSGQASACFSSDATTSEQIISGINTTITLKLELSGNYTSAKYYLNNNPTSFYNLDTIQISNNDSIYFVVYIPARNNYAYLTIKNQSDGNTVIGHFTFVWLGPSCIYND